MILNNNKKIISDKDIYLTDENVGYTLSEKLSELSEDISELKSNVKWLYKYGGTGSGKGGSGTGGSGDTNWVMSVKLNKITVDGSDIKLPGPGSYELEVIVYKPGGLTYSLSYECGNYKRSKILLKPENEWTYTTKLNVLDNTLLYVKVNDGELPKEVTANLIVSAYTFSLDIEHDKQLSLDGIIFNTHVNEDNPIKAKLNFKITSPDHYFYSLRVIKGNRVQFTTEGTVWSPESNSKPQGNIYIDLPIYEIEQYIVEVDISTLSEGQILQLTRIVEIIPNSPYVQVWSDLGIFYRSPQENYLKFKSANITINYKLRDGLDLGRNYPINWLLDGQWKVIDELLPDNIPLGYTIRERETYNTVLKVLVDSDSDSELHEITFRTYRLYNGEVEGEAYETKYYFYVDKTPSLLTYYGNDIRRVPNSFTYYDGSSSNIPSLAINTPSVISLRSYDDPLEIDLAKGDTTNSYSWHLAVGLLNSISNLDSSMILLLETLANTTITIYQNEMIVVENHRKGVFIPKINTFNNKDYTLLEVTGNLFKIDNQNYKMLIILYIDGVYEALYTSWLASSFIPIKLYIGGAKNLKSSILNIGYIDFSYILGASGETVQFDEFDVYRYYHTYRREVGFEFDEEPILNYLNSRYNFEFIDMFTPPTDERYPDTGMLKFTGDFSLFLGINIPMYKLTASSRTLPNGLSPLQWLQRTYKNDSDTSLIGKLPVLLSLYSSTGWQPVNTDVGENRYILFLLSILGSTSLAYKGKNFELEAELIGGTPEECVLFSPNYMGKDKTDYLKSFLPEKSFTLKADIVDSSSSNNVAIGKFVNRNTTKFNTLQSSSVFNPYVKNCLEGFPVLLFFDFTIYENDGDVNGVTTTYILGIYNFNLGRKSYNNLGYNNLDNLFLNNGASIIEDNNGQFTACVVDVDEYNKKPNLLVTEILDKFPLFDFSQISSEVLFNELGRPMFGDFEMDRLLESTYMSKLRTFVDRTRRAGAYVFSLMKNFIGDHGEDPSLLYGYRDGYQGDNYYSQVPNYRYVLTTDSKGNVVYSGNTADIDVNLQDLRLYIEESEENDFKSYINYASLVEYYVICMAFGLLDSVSKNMLLKSWDGGNTFYTAFYDMDTALGIDNNAEISDYFAFSDYWDENNIENSDGTLQALDVKIYRDFFKLGSHKGYDTPSSYLFGIAKYASILTELSNPELTPANIWGKFRASQSNDNDKCIGELRNALYFMENYFNSDLKNLNEIMFNLNYKFKYFSIINNSDYSNTDASKCSGRRLKAIEYWLNNRLHILDAYFNLEGVNTPIEKYDFDREEFIELSLSEPTPSPQIKSYYENNDDVIILTQIFGDNPRNLSGVGTLSLVDIRVNLLTPFILNQQVTLQKFLMSPGNTYTYNIGLTIPVNLIAGGSYNANYFSNVDPFVKSGSLTINSPFLTTVVVKDDKTILNSNINLNTPAVLDIAIYGNLCRTTLNLDNSNESLLLFNNLKSVRLGKYMSLSMNSVNLENLELDADSSLSRNNRTIDIQNSTFKKINGSSSGTFSNIVASRILITNNGGNLSFNDCRIKTYTLSAKSGEYALRIINDLTVTSISATGYKTIYIDNCPELTTLDIVSSNTTDIVVNNCSRLNLVSIQNLSGYEGGLADLRNLQLSNNKNLQYLCLPNAYIPESLNTLNLSNTQVKCTYKLRSEWPSDNPEPVEGEELNLVNRDITGINVLNNTAVLYIRLNNNENSPIILNNSFKGCSNLTRIYGHITLNNTTFVNCSKFKIGRSSNSTDFDSSNNATNVNFISNRDYEETFAVTDCSLVDIQYLLKKAGPITESIAGMFKGIRNRVTSLLPDLFSECTNVKNVSNIFGGVYISNIWYNTCASGVRVPSPIFNNDTLQTIGLFTPLAQKCENINEIFGRAVVSLDKNVFRLGGINQFVKLTKIENLYFNIVAPTSLSVDINNIDCGNFEGFFTNLLNIEILSNFATGATLIRYGNLELPPNIQTIKTSFESTYALDVISLAAHSDGGIFKNPSSIRNMQNSFSANLELVLDGVINSYIKFNDDTFKYNTNLHTIGGTDEYTHCFKGNIVKLVLGPFPYNILNKHHASTYKNVNGLFRGVDLTNCTNVSYLELPKNIFENTTNIVNAAYAFSYMPVEFKLTSEGFVNCHNLKNVSKIFKQCVIDGCIPKRLFYTGSPDVLSQISNLTGKLTNDGDSSLQESLENLINLDSPVLKYGYYRTIENMELCFAETVIKLPYSTDISRDDLLEVNPDFNPFPFVVNSRGLIENNSKYDPYLFTYEWSFDGVTLYDSATYINNKVRPVLKQAGIDILLATLPDTPKNNSDIPNVLTYQLAIAEFNDNLYNNPFNVIADLIIANVGLTSSTVNTWEDKMSNFAFAPDLFRYAKTNCNIDGTFKSQRLIYGYAPGMQSESRGIEGPRGRLCPYVLRPLTDLTSLNSLFENSILLIPTIEQDGDNIKNYPVPKSFFKEAKNLKILNNIFMGTMLFGGCNLDEIFNGKSYSLLSVFKFCNYVDYPIYNTLGEITDTVECIIGPISTDTTNKLLSVREVFAAASGEPEILNSLPVGWGSYVNYFGNCNVIFKNTLFSGAISPNNTNRVFRGYSYNDFSDRFKDMATSFNINSNFEKKLTF